MSGERFIYLDQQGRKVRLSDVGAVKAGMRHGTIRPDTLLFDSHAGGWSRAEFHPLYRQVTGEGRDTSDVSSSSAIEAGQAVWTHVDSVDWELAMPELSEDVREEVTGEDDARPDQEWVVGGREDRLILDSLGASLAVWSDEAPGDEPLDPPNRRVSAAAPERSGSERRPRPRRRSPTTRRRPAVVGSIVVVALLIFGVGAVLTRDRGRDSVLVARETGSSDETTLLRRESVGLRPELEQLTSSDLAARIREAMEQAHAEIVWTLARMAEVDDLKARPPDAWLEGAYLADAGSYPEVPAYWRALGLWAGDVKVGLPRIVKESYGRRLGEAGFEDQTARLLLMEALEDFRAAAPSREKAFAGFRNVIQAALDLHEFLVEHEASIEFEPFSRDRITRDPILEAVTADPALEEELWVRITRVTEALERMESLNQPTTDAVQRALLRRLEASLGNPASNPRGETERSALDSEG